jgi:hypothetical protein
VRPRVGGVVAKGQLAWPARVVDGVFPRAAEVGETVTLLVDADNAWALNA